MSDRPDLRELVGDDVPDDELHVLERVDAVLRTVPAPPAEVPASLTRAVRAAAPARLWTRRRVAVGAALAATLSALSLALGAGLGRDSGFEPRQVISMSGTADAPNASALIRLGSPGEDGNWMLELEAAGLPELPAGGYYVLWLARDGEYAGTCGTFRAGRGETTVRMNASYRLADYDEWVVTAHDPDAPDDVEPAWLLRAPIGSTYQ